MSARVPCPFSPRRTFCDARRLEIHVQRYHPTANENNVAESPVENLKKRLTAAKCNTQTLQRIPKSARFSVADKLCSVIKNCLVKNSLEAWSHLLLFSYIVLSTDRNKKMSLSTKIKRNITNFSLPDSVLIPRERNNEPSLSKRVKMKMDNFDFKGAVKILSSSDTLAPFDATTLSALQDKHPNSTDQSHEFPNTPNDDDISVVVNETIVRKMILSFPNGSAGGIDGFKPQYLKDVISLSASEAGDRVLTAITDLCNFMLAGKVTQDVCPFIYGASLFALNKKNGGIRPIAVGNTFRRLTAKLACHYAKHQVMAYLSPTQLGVGIPRGCEASIHAIRTFVNIPANKEKLLLKIDFSNAFNSISRAPMLEQVKEKVPGIYHFIHQCYRNPTHLFFGEDVVSSEMGCQQGDPCGPLLFSLAVQPIIQEISTNLNSWYLDDATLADTPDIVLENFTTLIEKAALIGLKVNPEKCEIHFCSQVNNKDVIDMFNSISPGIRVVNASELNLLGAPVYEEGFTNNVCPKVDNLKLMLERLRDLNAHIGFVLLKNCLLVPKLTYLLRTSPFWKFKDVMQSIDHILHSTLQHILNSRLDETQWNQATLPIRYGGIGVRKISDLALPAFISSAHGVQDLVSQLLPQDVMVPVHLRDEAVELWQSTIGDLPEAQHHHIQREWDNIQCEKIKINLPLNSNEDKARFLALQTKEAGAWLQVYPSTNIGTFMDDTSFRTCVGLRLGCKLFKPHLCSCGTMIDEKGLHGLSCA